MGKPIVMAFVTLISIYALTKSWYIAGCIDIIPLLFGLLNIFVKFGYAVAGFSLIAAVVWTVITPTMKLHLVRVAESVWEGLVDRSSQELKARLVSLESIFAAQQIWAFFRVFG